MGWDRYRPPHHVCSLQHRSLREEAQLLALHLRIYPKLSLLMESMCRMVSHSHHCYKSLPHSQLHDRKEALLRVRMVLSRGLTGRILKKVPLLPPRARELLLLHPV